MALNDLKWLICHKTKAKSDENFFFKRQPRNIDMKNFLGVVDVEKSDLPLDRSIYKERKRGGYLLFYSGHWCETVVTSFLSCRYNKLGNYTLNRFAFLTGQTTKLFVIRGCPRGVMVKTLNCGIVVSEFKLHSTYYVHFRTN